MAKNRSPSWEERINESRRAGRNLAQALAQGVDVPQVPVRVALRPGEFCVGHFPVQVLLWQEGEGTYVRSSGGYVLGGGALGMALNMASLATNVVGNSVRRANAAADAQAQWRHHESAYCYLTNRRIALQATSRWSDIWFNYVRTSDCSGHAIILQIEGWPATALSMSGADYWFVMFNWLAYNRIVVPPLPTDEVVAAEGALPGAQTLPSNAPTPQTDLRALEQSPSWTEGSPS